MMLKGKTWRFGDDVDTDVIVPARYLNTGNPEELKKHCMEDIDPEFSSKVQPGDIIVAGKNFGCGSSREHAPIAIKAAGISCIIARSFARIFYRNAINIGLPIFEIDEADQVKQGDIVEVDLGKSLITNLNDGKQYKAIELPQFLKDIYLHDGLIEFIIAESSSADA